jgi:lipopolysaccharide exporter
MNDSVVPEPDNRKLKHKVASGLRWSVPRSLITAGIEMATLVVMSWLLTPAEFGIPGVALAIVGMMVILVEFGVGPALIQRVSLEREHLGAGFAVVLLGGTLAILINVIAAEWLAQLLSMPELVGPLLAFSILILLQPYMTVMDALVRRALKFRVLAIADISGSFFGYAGVSLLAALNGWGMWSLVVGQIAAIAIRTAILSYAAGTMWTWRTTGRHAKEILDFGAFFSVGRVAGYLGQRFDRVLVGGLLGSEAAGLYQRAQNLLLLVYRQVTEPLDFVLFPIMSRVQNSSARLWTGFSVGTAGTAILTMPATVIATVVTPAFVPILFGAAWTPLIPPLQIMFLVTMTRPSDSIAGIISRATGAVRSLAFINVTYAALVLMGVAIGSTYGLVGVAWSVLAAAFIKFWMTNNLIRRILKVSLLKSLFPLVPGIIVAAAVALLALAFAMVSPTLLPTASGALVFAVAALALWGAIVLLIPNQILPLELAALRSRLIAHVYNPPR